MRFLVAIACIVAVASTALAEDQPGLDLSQPPKKDAPKDDGEELPPLDLSKPSQPAKDASASAPGQEKPAAFVPFSEKDVALGDKVKAVQRKGFLKRHRFELTPVFAATVNDAFYEKFGAGGRLAYNLQDSFALSLRAIRYWNYRTDNVREGRVAFQSQLLNADIEQQLMLDGLWSPIYGKAAVLAGSIVHFDVFLMAGLGLAWTATSNKPLEQGTDVPFGPAIDWPPFGDKKPAKLATDLGGGIRFYPKEYLAFELGLVATLYSDQPQPLLPATIQKVFAVNVGVTFFFPMSFEYVYPQ